MRKYLFRELICEKYVISLIFLSFFVLNNVWSVSFRDFRTWTVQDGLEENYSRSVSISPNGKVWIRHGDVPNITNYDGNEFYKIPLPGDSSNQNEYPSEDEYPVVYENPAGNIWGLRFNIAYKYINDEWQRYPIPPGIDGILSFYPIDENRILLLLSDQIVEFNIETMNTRVLKKAFETKLKHFVDLQPDRASGFWIVGENGIAKMIPSNNSDSAFQWDDFICDNQVYRNFRNLIVGSNAEVFVVASDIETDQTSLLQFDGHAWNKLYSEEYIQMGWLNPNGDIWVLLSNNLYFINDKIEKIDLSGRVVDAAVENNGVFWLATDQGLVRYSPSLWRTPLQIKHIKSPVHSICESSDGTVWFACGTHLASFLDGKWKTYPLPKGFAVDYYNSNAISILPDGRFVVEIWNIDDNNLILNHFLIFDPVSGIFKSIKHPEGKEIWHISQQNDGLIIAALGDRATYSIEKYDGNKFDTILNNQDWGIATLRRPFVAKNGDIWLGGVGGLGLYKNNKYKNFTLEDGFTENGAFSIHQMDNGGIWVGGRKEILAYDGTKWRSIKKTSAIVRSMITAKNGDAWIGADNGLYRKFDDSWVCYTVEDGLPSSTIRDIFEDSQGRLWCGTAKGLSLYYPDTDMDAPDTFLPSDLNTNNIHKDTNSIIVFEGKDRWEYTSSERLLFSYRIDNSEWSSYDSKKMVQIPVLNVGLHSVEVRALDTNLNADRSPARFDFQVHSIPIQDRFWFMPVLYSIIAVIILLALSLLYSRKKLAQYARNLESIVDERTAEIQFANEKLKQDMIKLKQAEDALQESERLYRSAIEVAGAVPYYQDYSCEHYEFVGPGIEKLTGYSADEFTYQVWESMAQEIVLMGDLTGLLPEEAINIAQQGEGISWRADYRLKTRTGEERWVANAAVQVSDDKGNIIGSLGILQDITDRKQTEESLNRLRNLLSNIINSMPSILIGVDSDGKVTQWNLQAEQTTGLKADQAHGRILNDVYPQFANEMDRIRKAIKECQVQSERKIAKKINDETRYSDITIYPLVANGVEGAVIRIDDVTERVRIEEMMIQSEKMLSVGGLAAGMAHEINNPLAGILQNIQVIRNRISDKIPQNSKIAQECGTTIQVIEEYMNQRKVPEMIDAVVDSGKRAAKIIDNMLSFSRKNESLFVPINISELLDDTIELASNDYDLKKKYDFRKIEIIREYEENMPYVKCEITKIQQVILNLLKNGAQSMAEKDQSIEMHCFIIRTKKEGNFAVIEIEDNGMGMNETTMKHAFEPFFTTKKPGIGTGLGLSISYFIITENHHGYIDVESTPGIGTKFIIKLPLVS